MKEIINKMSLDEKIAFCSGDSFWQTKEYPQYGIKKMFMCDGPHGLRKQTAAEDHLGLNASINSTCFPTASALGASWDSSLLEEVGAALGNEALQEKVNVILGPGTNMKRNPLCGRNFEYFSEDPFLSGKLSAAWIKGVQRKGIGVSLKHFAVNNQEHKRMSLDTIVDERALREYYFRPFEIAVKEGKPTTVMCAYNKINGTYCSDNKKLLNDVLRQEWGHKGAVITDWGATHDRISGFKAGLDLEMPGSKGRFDEEVKAAVDAGVLDEKDIDQSVERLFKLSEDTNLALSSHKEIEGLYERNHAIAKKAALASGILLKNEEEVLPLGKEDDICVIGALAKEARYQGTGSSQVTPTKLTNLLSSLQGYDPKITYQQGYQIDDKTDERLLQQAIALAKKHQKVILCVGLTDHFESEGFDRDHMNLPRNQSNLIQEILKVNSNVIVVLYGGSSIVMDWADQAKGILHMQLSGQAGGIACAELLLGVKSPSGRLSESYPYKYEDVVNHEFYGKQGKQALYMESMFCGYRYYSSAGVPVRYPFGYGLSYTSFAYHDFQITKRGTYDYLVTVRLKNTGKREGAEVVQLYVSPLVKGDYRPQKELQAFTKVFLKPGEEKQVELTLNNRSFSIYDQKLEKWIVEEGAYQVILGRHCEDEILSDTIQLKGKEPEKRPCHSWYYYFKEPLSKEVFQTIYPKITESMLATKGTYSLDSSIKEMKETSLIMKLIFRSIEKTVAKGFGGIVDYQNAPFRMLMDSATDNPIRTMALFSPEFMPIKRVKLLVAMANGHFLKYLMTKDKDTLVDRKGRK